jgi:hypothetical protein
VRFGEVIGPWRGDEEGAVYGTHEEAFIAVRGIGVFRIQGGREIVVDPAPGVDQQSLRVFLLGGALGLLLHQRGYLVLHASAVAIDNVAVVFLGNSGEGKSTLAFALCTEGHGIIADDIVAVDLSEPGEPRVLPAFPRLKIELEAAAALGCDITALIEFNADDERRHYEALGTAPSHPLLLRRVYVLDESDTPEIVPLAPQEAFAELIRYSYAVSLLGAPGATSTHLRQCATLAAATVVDRLLRPFTLESLSAVAQVVEREAQGQHHD